MAQVQPHARHAAGAQHGRAVGQHGACAFPHLHAARQAGRAGVPVVQHLVEGLHGAVVDGVGATADLGRAGHAHALAQARDGDLEALVHHAAARAQAPVGHGRADRIAIHRPQRQPDAQRRQQRGRLHAGADHHGVEALGLAGAGRAQGGGRRRVERQHRRAKAKARAQGLGRVAQDDGELAAVAHLVLGQMNRAGQRRGGVQRGLDGAGLRAVDFMKHHAGLAQHGQAGLRHLALALAAQQHHVAGAALERVVHALGHLVQALAAVEGQALQERAVGGVGVGPAGAQPARHPVQVGAGQRPRHAHRGVARQQVAQHLGRHAWRGQRRDVARGQHAGVGKAGALGHAGMALEDSDLVAVGGQFVRGGDADDAGAEDGDVHGCRAVGAGRWAIIPWFCCSDPVNLGPAPRATRQIANQP